MHHRGQLMLMERMIGIVPASHAPDAGAHGADAGPGAAMTRGPAPRFPRETLSFLRALKRNNRREWFNAHRDDYESVRPPADDRDRRAAGGRLPRVRARARRQPEGVDVPHLPRHALLREQDAVQDARRGDLSAAACRSTRAPACTFTSRPTGCGSAAACTRRRRRSCTRSASTSPPTAGSAPSSSRRRSGGVGTLEGERLQRVPRGFPKDHEAAEYLKFRQFLAGPRVSGGIRDEPDVLRDAAQRLPAGRAADALSQRAAAQGRMIDPGRPRRARHRAERRRAAAGSARRHRQARRLARASRRAVRSDLLLVAGAPPWIRVAGAVLPLPEAPLGGERCGRHRPRAAAPRAEGVSRDRHRRRLVPHAGPRPVPHQPPPRARAGGGGDPPVALVRAAAGDARPSSERRSADEIPRGLVLVGGPTGSGKTTTLAALVNEINLREARHIITIEDPIEYEHPASPLGHRTGRDRHRRAGFSDRASRRAPPGARHHRRRRDARSRNDADGAGRR